MLVNSLLDKLSLCFFIMVCHCLQKCMGSVVYFTAVSSMSSSASKHVAFRFLSGSGRTNSNSVSAPQLTN